jgi:hypothetical protein
VVVVAGRRWHRGRERRRWPAAGWSASLGAGGARALGARGASCGRCRPRTGARGGFYRVKVQVTTPLGDHNTVAGLLLVGIVAAAVLAQEDRRWWAGTR